MTVFLTPAGEPFYGGTYYPPEPRHGLPSFRQVLESIAEAWRERRGDVARAAGAARRGRAPVGERAAPSREPLTDALLAEAERGIARTFEPAFGGFGRAPKFPPASTLEFLLRRRRATRLEMVEKTLDGMAPAGMYDLVGGGFHRYSVDDRWLVPHFEKMLYDNALLVPAYLHGWHVLGASAGARSSRRPATTCCASCAPEGGFASAQDADTDGVEGLTFTWTVDDGVPAELLEPFEHGRSIIRGELDRGCARAARRALERRPQPGLDDKAIASWNGLAIAALAEAGRRLAARLGRRRRGRAEFVLGPLSTTTAGRLAARGRDGRTSGAGFLDDYANVAHGLLELHVATGELRWLDEADCAPRRVELFADEERGGFFLSPADGERLVARTQGLDDQPLPSGTRCSRTCCSGSRGSTATTSSSVAPSRSSGSSRRRSPARRAPSAGRSARSTST